MVAAIETQEVAEKKQKREKMILVSFHIPKPLLDIIDGLVRQGVYPNRSEAIRDAIRLLLEHFRDNQLHHEAQPQ
jgi:Arc/MetJ-type ribon-helix-helix transcriptional regulator